MHIATLDQFPLDAFPERIFLRNSETLLPSVVTIVFLASFILLSIAMKTVGAFLTSVFVLGEEATLLRVVAAMTIVAGLLLMELSTPSA